MPIAGLLLFAMVSYRAVERNYHLSTRYFWWSAIQLDKDPLNRQNKSEPSCKEQEGCWEPIYIWVAPGWPAEILVLSAFPAFLTGMTITRGLGRLGVNEVGSFMAIMPVAIFAWYYFCGWLIDRRKRKG